MFILHNIEARSRNHFCRGKEISITYFCVRARRWCLCVCVGVGAQEWECACASVALLILHEKRGRLIVICCFFGSKSFYDIS